MVRHQHEWWTGRVARPLREVVHQLLAPADVEAGGRFVEQDDAGLVHQRPRQEHALSFAGGECGQPVIGERARAEVVEQFEGAGAVGGSVRVPPRRERGVLGRHHDLGRRHARLERGAERGEENAIRSRSVRTSQRPSRSPSTSTVPRDGCW